MENLERLVRSGIGQQRRAPHMNMGGANDIHLMHSMPLLIFLFIYRYTITQFSYRNISFINFEINYRNSHHVLQLNFALFLCDGEELDYLIEAKQQKKKRRVEKRSRKILKKIFTEISCNVIFAKTFTYFFGVSTQCIYKNLY